MDVYNCSDNRDRNIFNDIDPTGRLYRLYSDNLPSFSHGDYFYRMGICSCLNSLATGDFGSIQKHASIINLNELGEVEKSILDFVIVSHKPFVSDGLNDYFETFGKLKSSLQAYMNIDSGTRALPYHQVQRCTKLFEHLRILTLFINIPLQSLQKPQRLNIKKNIASVLDSISDLIAQSKQYYVRMESDLAGTKAIEYVQRLSGMVDSFCMIV